MRRTHEQKREQKTSSLITFAQQKKNEAILLSVRASNA